MFKQNENSTDRMIRVGIGIISLLVGAFWFTGPMQTIAYVAGAITLITGIIGYCSLYAIFGISTCPIKK